ncbi:MAG: hypothetical protein JSV63_04105 [Candidatus Aenigmatarchaeota archaeon]|nr:MAG: hypothetical protein JSV63_04105 [Candidatus Aenigmarchaeota archaeon]
MTEKTSSEVGRKDDTRPEYRLYADDPIGQAAHSRSLLGDIADTAIRTVFKGAKAVAERGKARTEPYTGAGANVESGRVYSDADVIPIEDYITARPASQSWLRWITGKIRDYVYGASVDDSEHEGTYIDEGLFERAKRYLEHYWEGAKDKARKYAADFVEGILTDGHERGHYNEKYGGDAEGERLAERAGRGWLNYLREHDEAVDFAVRHDLRRAA